MIGNTLINELLEQPERFVEQGRSYLLLEEYFDGLPVESLRPLLRHEDENVIRAAVWIASELGNNGCELLEDVAPLIDSTNLYVKYYAMEIVALCSESNRPGLFLKVIRQLLDDDDDTKVLTMHLVANASRSQLRACSELTITGLPLQLAKGLGFLVNDQVDSLQLASLIESSDQIYQMIGAIVVKRNLPGTASLIDLLHGIDDPVVQNFCQEFDATQ